MSKIQHVMRWFVMLMLSLGFMAGTVATVGAQDGSPTITIGGNTNSNNTSQGNSQSQSQTPSQNQDVDQDNTNNATQNSTSSATAGGSATSGCDATQGEDSEGADNTECASGDASAGDSSVGDSSQSSSSSQSGSNSNSQNQTSAMGDQTNGPSNTTSQETGNDLSGIGGDVNNSVVRTVDDNSDDDGTDNKEGEINRSTNNDGIEGDGNIVNDGALLEGLLGALTDLVRTVLNSIDVPEPTGE